MLEQAHSSAQVQLHLTVRGKVAAASHALQVIMTLTTTPLRLATTTTKRVLLQAATTLNASTASRILAQIRAQTRLLATQKRTAACASGMTALVVLPVKLLAR
jgi:hypothetical protein